MGVGGIRSTSGRYASYWNAVLFRNGVKKRLTIQNVSPDNVRYVNGISNFNSVDSNTVEYLMGKKTFK